MGSRCWPAWSTEPRAVLLPWRGCLVDVEVRVWQGVDDASLARTDARIRPSASSQRQRSPRVAPRLRASAPRRPARSAPSAARARSSRAWPRSRNLSRPRSAGIMRPPPKGRTPATTPVRPRHRAPVASVGAPRQRWRSCRPRAHSLVPQPDGVARLASSDGRSSLLEPRLDLRLAVADVSTHRDWAWTGTAVVPRVHGPDGYTEGLGHLRRRSVACPSSSLSIGCFLRSILDASSKI